MEYIIKNQEVREYFIKRYNECNFTIVPGHHPRFKTKKEVDEWIKREEEMLSSIKKIIGGGVDE